MKVFCFANRSLVCGHLSQINIPGGENECKSVSKALNWRKSHLRVVDIWHISRDRDMKRIVVIQCVRPSDWSHTSDKERLSSKKPHTWSAISINWLFRHLTDKLVSHESLNKHNNNKPFAKLDLLLGALQILFHQHQLSGNLSVCACVSIQQHF